MESPFRAALTHAWGTWEDHCSWQRPWLPDAPEVELLLVRLSFPLIKKDKIFADCKNLYTHVQLINTRLHARKISLILALQKGNLINGRRTDLSVRNRYSSVLMFANLMQVTKYFMKNNVQGRETYKNIKKKTNRTQINSNFECMTSRKLVST